RLPRHGDLAPRRALSRRHGWSDLQRLPGERGAQHWRSTQQRDGDRRWHREPRRAARRAAPARRGLARAPRAARAPRPRARADAAQRVRVEEGDVLLVGTGRDARRAAQGPWDPVAVGLAGLDARCIPWLHERRIAVLGSDGVSDALPGAGIEGWPIPVHQCCLVAMGVPLLDNLALAELARACAERGRYEFLFLAAPLRVPGGTGSPLDPIAVF